MKYIDTTQLVQISRGNKDRMTKYLVQFEKLIPERIEVLKIKIEDGDRRAVRQVLHQMSPQLQFFGIPEVVDPIIRLEKEYESIPLDDLRKLVHFIIRQLELAHLEVREFLKNL